MTTWFTSDTHFGHERIIELSNRPFPDVETMNEAIIERWNAAVKPEDTVFHLGDVALGKIADSLPLVGRLNGTKILVLGNHDRPFMEREQVTRYERKNNAAKVEKHSARFLDALSAYREVFQGIRWFADLPLGEHTVSLSHFPYDGDSQGEDRHRDARLPDNGRILIHGHTHMADKVTHSAKGTLQIHVGMDAWNYRPVSEQAVAMLIQGFTSIWSYEKETTDEG